MQVIPAVDVLGDDAVRLERGDYDRVLFRQPLEAYVERVLAATTPDLLHIVDLQGARDGAFRPEVLSRCQNVSGATPLQVSGGIRTPEQATALLQAGATRLIVGTAAFATPEAMTKFVEAIGFALVVAIDVKDGLVATKGWLASSGLTPEEAVERCLHAGVARIHATAVDRDGTMGGPDLSLYRRLCTTGIAVVAAGGVRDMNDVAALETIGCEGAVMGTALAQQLGIF
ncbi:MAG: HisA/HisF-related TIM barrel protein [Actinobacteria bacterium]|nr:HisA/HisF-related TIM barrel protein [Actinomycetota bacterium]